MFAQIIIGRVQDVGGLRAQFDKWSSDLRPEAVGFVDSTVGATSDGRFVTVARFESADAARANSNRSEQGAWWKETEALLSDVEFFDSTDVIEVGAGVSPAAGFVQAMVGRIVDGDAFERMLQSMDEWEEQMRDFRPDVLGGITVRHSEDRYLDLIYFVSEAEARVNEAKEPPPEMAAMFEEGMSAVEIAEYLDVTDPWII